MTPANKNLWFIFVAVAIAVVAAAYLWLQRESAPPPSPPAEPEPRAALSAPPPVVSAPVAPAEPQVLHPIETAQQQVAGEIAPEPDKEAVVSALDGSDAAMLSALEALYGADAPGRFFHVSDFVRRIVVSVDALPSRQAPSRHSPMKAPGGLFVTHDRDGNLYLGPANYARYTPYIRLLQSADPKKVVAVYVRLYPLFQQAYQELGYPRGYFNDRLVEVIDHLLAAPDVPGPIKLVQPRVLFQFEDPKLEALSAGEKGLIRMGSENAGKVKGALREIRGALTGQLPPQ